MQHVLIIHEVAGIRREAGERSYQVLRYENDPNRIVHFSTRTSIADARAFFESPRLIEIRARAL